MTLRIAVGENEVLPKSVSRNADFVALFVLVAIYAWVGYSSPGYDDEFTNIVLVEHNNVGALLHIVSTTDVHPPGSYLINWTLFGIFHDWRLVRLVTALFSATALWGFFLSSTRSARPMDKLFAYVSICLSPTVLLWSTGLRWYSYFIPTLLLIYCSLRPALPPWRYYLTLWLGLAILFHIGYAALIITPSVVLYALLQRWTRLRQEAFILVCLAAVVGLLCVPQLLQFLHYHLPNAATQTASFPSSLKGLALQLSSGQAEYPTSLAGAALIVGNAVAFALLLRLRTVLLKPSSAFFFSGCLLFVGSGLAGKYRNLTVIAPFQGLLTSQVFSASRSRRIRTTLLLLFAFGNLYGIANVMTHTNTTKGGWNTPYREVLNALAKDAQSCRQVIVITSDPVFRYYGSKLGFKVATERTENGPPQNFAGRDDCIVSLKTFRGALSQQRYQELYSAFDHLRARSVRIQNFGRDDFAAFKRKLDPDVPDYYVTVTLYQGPANPEILDLWDY